MRKHNALRPGCLWEYVSTIASREPGHQYAVPGDLRINVVLTGARETGAWYPSASRPPHHVADRPDRDEVTWVQRVVLELLSQAGHMSVDGSAHCVRLVAPYIPE